MHEGIADIYRLLEDRRLKEALVQLQAVSLQIADWDLRNRIEEVSTNYNYMLQYARMGVNDPKRKDMYNDILLATYELTDLADITLQIPHQGGIYFDLQRAFKQRPAVSYSNLLMRLEAFTEDIGTVSILYTNPNQRKAETEKICQNRENTLDELFNKTWTNLRWSDAEASEAQQIIDSLLVGSNDKAILISAVMMSLLQIFDKQKIHFLIHNCKNEDIQVSQRAIVSLVLVVEKHYPRIENYTQIQSQLSLLLDNDAFCKSLHTIYMQIAMTRTTPQVSKKMNEDIIPGIIKMQGDKMPFQEKDEEVDINPDWEKWMDNSGLGNKLREMDNLIREGADVYHSAFSMLKNIPFFNKVSHWFYPFDKYQPTVLPLAQSMANDSINTFNLLMNSDLFCNSDKYSLCFSLTGMNDEVKKMVLSQLPQEKDMSDMQKELVQRTIDRSKEAKCISRHYIQDLYRFSTLWTTGDSNQTGKLLKDIDPIGNSNYFNKVLRSVDYMWDAAAFHFQIKDYDRAYRLYFHLLYCVGDNEVIHQRLGYIYQKKKDWLKAIEHYKKSDLIVPDNVWALKHIAQCYKLTERYKEAIEIYKKLEALCPDDLGITQQIGECLIKEKEYDNALPYFYKLEYLGKNPINARKAIAWCMLCLGNYGEALKHYHNLLQEETADKNDWLNTGHTYLLIGNMPQAIEHYTRASELCKNHTELYNMFMKDLSLFIKAGLSKDDLVVLIDLFV